MAARRLPGLTVLLIAVAVAAPTQASPALPDALRDHLGLHASPGCDLCHASPMVPLGPADRPFALSAKARGLASGDVDALDTALDRMSADGVDSDKDGAEDLDELWWGGDPNHADLPEGGTPIAATYGCALAPGAPGSAAVFSKPAATAPRLWSGSKRRTG